MAYVERGNLISEAIPQSVRNGLFMVSAGGFPWRSDLFIDLIIRMMLSRLSSGFI
jgi:hypothetical protein